MEHAGRRSLQPPAETDYRAAAERAAERMREYKVRGEVVDRLILGARRYIRHHADRVWDGKTPLGPHFLVFFYREPEGTVDPTRESHLRVATRIDQADEDVADLYGMVTQLHALAEQYVSYGRFDPRRQLANRAESMSPNAEYIGFGVGTLDPPDNPDDIGDTLVSSHLHLPTDVRPFRGIAELHDGTRLVVRWDGGSSTPRTESTKTMNVGPLPTRMWSWLNQAWEDDDSEAGRIGAAVSALNQYILSTHPGARHSRNATPQAVTAVQEPVDDHGYLFSQSR